MGIWGVKDPVILHKEGKHIPVEKKERGFRLAAERLTELACKVEALMIL